MTTLNSRLQLALIKNKKSKNTLQKGFTLVELLIVVVILGVLSSVALPAFLNQTGKAKENAATASVTAAAKACEVFLVGNDDPNASWPAPDGVFKADGTTTATCAYGEVFASKVDGLGQQAQATLGSNGGVKVTQDALETAPEG
jgi:type IV pilus assembly protein PilA